MHVGQHVLHFLYIFGLELRMGIKIGLFEFAEVAGQFIIIILTDHVLLDGREVIEVLEDTVRVVVDYMDGAVVVYIVDT